MSAAITRCVPHVAMFASTCSCAHRPRSRGERPAVSHQHRVPGALGIAALNSSDVRATLNCGTVISAWCGSWSTAPARKPSAAIVPMRRPLRRALACNLRDGGRLPPPEAPRTPRLAHQTRRRRQRPAISRSVPGTAGWRSLRERDDCSRGSPRRRPWPWAGRVSGRKRHKVHCPRHLRVSRMPGARLL